MADTVYDTRTAIDELEDRSFDRPPAIVCNAHITGLAVARALADHGVPVVTLDRSPDGVAPYSEGVELAGLVTYPLDDLEAFGEELAAIADALEHDPVLFPCMDEWVHAVADLDPDRIDLPFADFETVDAILDKTSLYERADELDVPTPETYRLDETDPDAAADELNLPLIVKPALKRRFEDAFGTNLVEVESREEYDEIVERARDADMRVMAQEKIPKEQGDLYTLASYVPESGVDDAVTFVGRRRAIYPPDFGTTCLVSGTDVPEIERDALAVLDDAGYHGISEAEFLYDARTDEYRLLDINTRPWKWIGLPIAAGANLPAAAYADATGGDYEPGVVRDATWVYLKDYATLLANHAVEDHLSREQWRSIVAGEFERRDDLTTAVYRPSDPDPTYRLLATEFGTREYYCPC
ncbi:carboxylate--amine ligase [Natrinema salifodinae]|uniref:Predicted ATP-dependent carboligase, ATP-grasp superfamily n=1 Tax=Natrinema salifodinae TaxID=1202768 RepID=A0A1I0NMH4_9EURY|nr:carboxylate--amine ligase [Natrinema salifodinae]SEW02075.1 Predicted ATP-dependent carboligase, ATP-grasp superfamily [Natrinema salifodinae]